MDSLTVYLLDNFNILNTNFILKLHHSVISTYRTCRMQVCSCRSSTGRRNNRPTTRPRRARADPSQNNRHLCREGGARLEILIVTTRSFPCVRFFSENERRVPIDEYTTQDSLFKIQLKIVLVSCFNS